MYAGIQKALSMKRELALASVLGINSPSARSTADAAIISSISVKAGDTLTFASSRPCMKFAVSMLKTASEAMYPVIIVDMKSLGWL